MPLRPTFTFVPDSQYSHCNHSLFSSYVQYTVVSQAKHENYNAKFKDFLPFLFSFVSLLTSAEQNIVRI
jgi:hypothetical protein